jgi:hypothetical protein
MSAADAETKDEGNQAPIANPTFGTNRFAEKQADLEAYKENDMDVEKFKKMAAEAQKELKKELASSAKQIIDVLTPGFVRRALNSKIHSERIAKNDYSAKYMRSDIEKKIAQVKVATKKAKKERKRLKADNIARGVLQSGAVAEKASFKAAEVKKQEDDYVARREMQLSEVQAEIDKKVKAIKDEEARVLLEKRAYNLKHWKTIADEVHLEAVESNKKVHGEKTRTYRGQMDALYDEWAERDLSRIKTQVVPSMNSDPIGLPGGELGIFGTPMGEGEYQGMFEDAGHKPILDDHDVHVFHSEPNTEYEKDVHILEDSKHEEMRLQALYDSINSHSQELSGALDRLVQMRDLTEKDEFQVTQEMLLIERDQIGPPRRAPHNHEVEPTHLRKAHIMELRRKQAEYQHCIDKAESEKRDTDSQLLSLASKLAKRKDVNKIAQAEIDSVNEGLGQLPMVIGRSITKVPGSDITHKPKELLNAIKQQSKLVETEKMVQFAIKTHKERNELDQQLWVAKQSGNETKNEANHVVNRLAEISEKMNKQHLDSAKRNIIEALNAFLFRKILLNPMSKKLSGLLPWYVHRDENLTKNCVPYKSSNAMGGIIFEIDPEEHDEDMLRIWSNGVTLGNSLSGFCVGVLELPKMGMWSVLCTVCRQGNGAEFEHDDPTDMLTVSLGSSLGTLTKCLICYNRVNPLTGSVLYDVNFVFRGDFLAYRFDFLSSTADEKRHMAVSVGLYEEYEIKGVEVSSDPMQAGAKGGQRVLSSYVKMIRIDSQQGKFRETKLLEELIALEDNTTVKFWDSDIVSKVPQRYSRDYFLKILKAEILLEQRSGNAKLMEVLDKRAKVQSKLGKTQNVAEQLLDRSREEFTSRKRQKQSNVLTLGKQLVSKRIEIHDSLQNIWRHVQIKECVVRWLDNGLTAKCIHVVIEQNDGFENVGVPFEIDISRCRWFESAIQELDDSAKLKWRRQKQFNKRLADIDKAIEDKVSEMRNAYESFRNAEEEALRTHTTKTLKKLNKHVDKMAITKADSWQGQREIKQGVANCLLDMRCGTVEIDTTVKAGVQAARLSRERWIEKWISNKRESVMDELFSREKAVEARINARRETFIAMEKGVIDLAANEKYSLTAQIKEYQQQQKIQLMKRVKFDPKKFQLAVPQGQSCMHTRTKNWGDKYGKGIRCKDCGKELSNIDEEASQMLGYGTGTPEELWEAITRHRDDEAAFRFKNSDELSLVEHERLRMEKERRVMEENEAFFYDFLDLKAIYNFDRRHAKFIKGAGIFRQGLQWTEEELRSFELDMKYQEVQRIKENNLVETMIDKFDPLNCIEEPPPTFRGMDEKRRANYNEYMFMMGRLHTYQKKIAKLKEDRLDLLSDRTIYAIVLEFLHKESYGYDQELNEIEKDLDKTNLLLSTFDKMERLWKSANRIQNQANKDKLKAEMKQCGVWDDVKDMLEKASWLHDETLNLLRVKYMYDSQLEGKKHIFNEQQRQYIEKQEKLEELQLESSRLSYCRPGDLVMTRYGDGIIRQYRKKDDMLLVTLSFCNPVATAYIHASEIVHQERARQQGEKYLMTAEDDKCKKFYTTERRNCKFERYAMAKEEEGLCDLYKFQDLGNEQDSVALAAVNKEVADKFVIMGTHNFQKTLTKAVDKKVNIVLKKQVQQFSEYNGPAAGRPKKPTFFWIWDQRKNIIAEMQKGFLAQAAVKAENNAHENFTKVRAEWVRDNLFGILINETIEKMILETAKETYHEGKMAKKSAERLSGLIFPNPKTMQYDAYRSLVEVWKYRKNELRKQIEINRGLASKGAKAANNEIMSEEEMMEIKIHLRKERQERIRQKAICKIMEADEIARKEFYQWELKQNLIERRLMKTEENEMKNFIKAEQKAIKEAEEERKRGYLVSDKLAEEAALAKARAQKAEGFDARRKQLAAEVQAKRRAAEDQALMLLEDDAGKLLREIDIKDRLRKKMAATLGVSENDLVGQDLSQLGGGGDDEDGFIEIPDWFTAVDIPDNWDDWPPARQRNYVTEKTDIRERQLSIDRNVDIAHIRLDKLEDTSYDKWREWFAVVEQDEMETELQVMNMREISRQYEHDLQTLEQNIHRILIFCREKGEEELKAKSLWRKKQALARKRDKELADAKAWLDLCTHRARQRDKIKRKVVENCLWIDTDSITGFHQRFKTELLRERLYWSYFKRILDSIITRAEIIASERHVMAIQEKLSINKAILVERTYEMKERWHDIQRDEYMRMRKSVLNKKFFPNHRKETLKQRFSSWVRFFLWNRGHREAFELKYELLKRQMDVDRQYKEQLKLRQSYPQSDVPDRLTSYEEKKKASLGPTGMQRHREHVVYCQDCKAMYLESQNHSLSCRFHLAKFAMHCPRDCPAPGLTAKCASHRIKRWTCCDSVKAEAAGCSRKNHTPRPVDVVYDKMMSKIIKRDQEMSDDLDVKLAIARKGQWGQQEMKLKRGQVLELEGGIQKQRDQADRYKDIKFV